jgi:hypothetical protein
MKFHILVWWIRETTDVLAEGVTELKRPWPENMRLLHVFLNFFSKQWHKLYRNQRQRMLSGSFMQHSRNV